MRKFFAHWKQNLYLWMDHSEDLWKERARGAQVPSNVLTISLNKKLVEAPYESYRDFSEYNKSNGHHVMAGSLKYAAHDEECRAVSNFTNGKVVIVAVNGKEVSEYDSRNSVRKWIELYERRGDNVTLRLRREEDLMFSFLPLVIELGLVEENGVDPNRCFPFRLDGSHRPTNGPVIFYAACQEDPACVKYLLSEVEIIPDSRFGSGGRHPVPLLLHACRNSPSLVTFLAVLCHPFVRMHQINGIEDTTTPLMALLYDAYESIGGSVYTTDLLVEKIAALLDAGADPTHSQGGSQSPISTARRFLEESHRKLVYTSYRHVQRERKEKITVLEKVVSMMEEAMRQS